MPQPISPLPSPSPAVTIADIARVCGVSSASVSRVLNGLPGVNAAKRKQMLEVANNLGYRPNRAAQRLVNQKSHLLGFIASDLRNTAYLEYFYTLERAMRKDGYEFLIADSERSAQREQANIERMLDNRVDGLLILPVSDWVGPGEVSHLKQLSASALPCVLFGELRGLKLDSVSNDERFAAALLVRHLYDLGHRHLGFVGISELQNRPAKQRLDGVKAALSARNIAPSTLRTLTAHTPGWIDRLLAWFREPTPPTAVICVDDLLALSLIRPLQTDGLIIPRDVALCGFGKSMIAETVMAELSSPSLTRVEFDHPLVAENGAAMLLERIAKPGLAPRTVYLPSTLVARESTGAHRA